MRCAFPPYGLKNLEEKMSFQLEERRIYILTGRMSQTVNICHKEKRRGKYEWVIRLHQPYFVNEDNIRDIVDIKGLIRWLTEERKGEIEKYPHSEGTVIQVSATEPSIELKYNIVYSPIKRSASRL
jgi:hypothetical protein